MHDDLSILHRTEQSFVATKFWVNYRNSALLKGSLILFWSEGSSSRILPIKRKNIESVEIFKILKFVFDF